MLKALLLVLKIALARQDLCTKSGLMKPFAFKGPKRTAGRVRIFIGFVLVLRTTDFEVFDSFRKYCGHVGKLCTSNLISLAMHGVSGSLKEYDSVYFAEL